MKVTNSLILDFLAIISAFLLRICFGELFSMLSSDQEYVVDPGGHVTLKCVFYKAEFNLFDNPVLWNKHQFDEHREINIMGNIKLPFEPTDRFSVSFESLAPRFALTLNINNLSLADTGNYSCEVFGPEVSRSVQLGIVTYSVFVRAPVQELYIVKGNRTVDPVRASPPSITFIENEPSPLSCVARGGAPPPDMELFIERTDYTRDFTVESSYSVSGELGFRLLDATTVLKRDDFRAGSDDDGKMLKCKAKVNGLTKVVKSAKISVNYAPQIVCSPSSAKLSSKNVRITCDVMSRPDVTSWHWVLDQNGTVISEGEIVKEYWTIYTQRKEFLHLQLYIRQVREEAFRTYYLVASNDVATSTQEITLERIYRQSELLGANAEHKTPSYGNRQAGRVNRDPSSLTSSGHSHVLQTTYSRAHGAVICLALGFLRNF